MSRVGPRPLDIATCVKYQLKRLGIVVSSRERRSSHDGKAYGHQDVARQPRCISRQVARGVSLKTGKSVDAPYFRLRNLEHGTPTDLVSYKFLENPQLR